jgi:radical SAM superfamily enzyme YgiQ (UPF0313 family)
MKVVVVNSPLFRIPKKLEYRSSVPPIGLGLIATAIKNKGFSVELIDTNNNNFSLKKLISKIVNKKPDFVCTNVFTTNLELVKELVESIYIKTHFIIGGLATQYLYKDIFKWNSKNPIDIIHGDGELITTDIIENNIKQNISNKLKSKRYFKIDKSSEYFVRDINNEKLDRNFFTKEPQNNYFGFPEAHIITGRGCNYKCAFCAAARSLNSDYLIREKSTESIISEIKHLQSIYSNLKSIRILDDLFLKNKKSIEKAINIFNKFDLKWRSMAHVFSFKDTNEDVIEKLKLNGCSELFIGIDSGSQRILKKIHKIDNINLIKENLTRLFKNSIPIKAYFIYGFPDETEEDFKLTYDLAEYLKMQSIKYHTSFRTSVFQFRPYHGTELYQYIIAKKGKDAIKNMMKQNKELSETIGRHEFNFQSGNYSEADIKILNDYIAKTIKLNEN